MTTLLLVAGSQRRDSLNLKLLRSLAPWLQQFCRPEFLEPSAVDLPLFNQDDENCPEILGRVTRLHRRFVDSDGLIVACPEYNGQPTPYLKNLIDWVSRLSRLDHGLGEPFLDRPVLLCSASSGESGGRLVLPYLRALFAYVGCVVIGDEISVAHAERNWNAAACRFDGLCRPQVTEMLRRLCALADEVAIRRAFEAHAA